MPPRRFFQRAIPRRFHQRISIVVQFRQQFRFFRGYCHITAPKTASARIALQIAKIAAACPRVIGVCCRSGPGPG
jgi:hypothetical protein